MTKREQSTLTHAQRAKADRDGAALGREWWRAVEMGDDFDGIARPIAMNGRYVAYWFGEANNYFSGGKAPTPAAALVKAHRAWRKARMR